eukprot:SAG25_NODE_516_length_7270_cov_1.909497_9_plen_90_part_00
MKVLYPSRLRLFATELQPDEAWLVGRIRTRQVAGWLGPQQQRLGSTMAVQRKVGEPAAIDLVEGGRLKKTILKDGSGEMPPADGTHTMR